MGNRFVKIGAVGAALAADAPEWVAVEHRRKSTVWLALTLLALSGCATCEMHPMLCGVGAAVLVGSVAASVEHHHDQQTLDKQKRYGLPVNCSGVAFSCVE